jgi:hypothetical protein
MLVYPLLYINICCRNVLYTVRTVEGWAHKCVKMLIHISPCIWVEPHPYFTLTSVQAEKDPSGTWVNIFRAPPFHKSTYFTVKNVNE